MVCVHSDEVEVFPHFLQEVVKVPLVVGGDWHGVGYPVDDVQLLHGNLVYLVQDVDAGDVHPIRGWAWLGHHTPSSTCFTTLHQWDGPG